MNTRTDVFFCNESNDFSLFKIRARNQKIPSGGWGGGGGVLTFFLVINVFNTESRTDLPREAIGPLGPIVSRGGPYQYF